MKKIALLPLGILSGLLLTIGFLWMGSSPNALATLPQPLTTTTPIPPAGEANRLIQFNPPAVTMSIHRPITP